jgi:hypothetical protein
MVGREEGMAKAPWRRHIALIRSEGKSAPIDRLGRHVPPGTASLSAEPVVDGGINCLADPRELRLDDSARNDPE